MDSTKKTKSLDEMFDMRIAELATFFLCIAHHRKAGGYKRGLENGGSGLCFIWISCADGGRPNEWYMDKGSASIDA